MGHLQSRERTRALHATSNLVQSSFAVTYPGSEGTHPALQCEWKSTMPTVLYKLIECRLDQHKYSTLSRVNCQHRQVLTTTPQPKPASFLSLHSKAFTPYEFSLDHQAHPSALCHCSRLCSSQRHFHSDNFPRLLLQVYPTMRIFVSEVLRGTQALLLMMCRECKLRA